MERLAALLLLLLAACVDTARLPPAATMGPDPLLPEPVQRVIPTVLIAPAQGWPDGVTPSSPQGNRVVAFAKGLNHPRWLHVLPNGDVLVAETSAPPRPDEGKGIKGRVMARYMKKAGAAVQSANRITLLRDIDGDGIADARSVFLDGLNSPFGMALAGPSFYVANTDAVLRFPYAEGRITGPGEKLADLPAGPRNHHWTKNLIASPDGKKLYATVGSNSNVAEHGMEEEQGRAAIWEIDMASGAKRLVAAGLRDPNGLGWEPATGILWTVVNERDELGSDLVPDYLTAVRDGGFYGWPYVYYGKHIDERVQPPRPDLAGNALKPDYALGSHVAPLGLAFAQDGAYIGQHGSWNRKPLSGYNVVFVAFREGRPAGLPVEVLGGFVSPEGKAYGRPVGVALDGKGALLVADDVGNAVWRLALR
jgi:glucose/arabinose dehydrogenase